MVEILTTPPHPPPPPHLDGTVASFEGVGSGHPAHLAHYSCRHHDLLLYVISMRSSVIVGWHSVSSLNL